MKKGWYSRKDKNGLDVNIYKGNYIDYLKIIHSNIQPFSIPLIGLFLIVVLIIKIWNT